MERARATAARIVEQVRSGASFVAYARQYSEASTAAVGGDMGWVMDNQLSAVLRPVAEALPKGQISDPVEIPGGITVLAKVDQREVLGADPKAAVITAKQIAVPVSDPSPRQTGAQRSSASTRRRAVSAAAAAPKLWRRNWGDVTNIDPQPLGQFAEGLQPAGAASDRPGDPGVRHAEGCAGAGAVRTRRAGKQRAVLRANLCPDERGACIADGASLPARPAA
ncbi:hypothetical protein E6W36_13915 [Hankyongella ginsenosidimutans]|uniref:Parvulin-like PPIase n=1 Tax=Hankyongella ginsenosidimutans TaxID=1763828 RepID=A0A4D7CA98_9SPHN|nr:hypothetical protein E6W36_13915 [Hankyongella ginsenosidimutans]